MVSRVLPKWWVATLLLVVLLSVQGCRKTTVVSFPPSPTESAPVLSVHIRGNQFLDQNGRPIRLLGVNRSGTEYACAEGWGIFDGPSDAASVAAMASWRINAVRVPLNESCWLGIDGVDAALAGDAYRRAIGEYVRLLHGAGLIAILDLHWSASGGQVAGKSPLMPNADHSPDFWRSVAAYFREDGAVAFDLFNEPREVDWACWRSGCPTPFRWQAAGMQALVDAVRSTGADQPILVSGLNHANDLSQWLVYKPTDPKNQLAANFHVYNDSECNTVSCWDAEVAPVASTVPVVTGELGQDDCAHAFIDSYMEWADSRDISYLGWSWNELDCAAQPALITSYDGTPTEFGKGLRDHLASLAWPDRRTTTSRQPANGRAMPAEARSPLLSVRRRRHLSAAGAAGAGWHRRRRPLARPVPRR